MSGEHNRESGTGGVGVVAYILHWGVKAGVASGVYRGVPGWGLKWEHRLSESDYRTEFYMNRKEAVSGT